MVPLFAIYIFFRFAFRSFYGYIRSTFICCSPELYELFPEYVVLFKMAGAFQTFSMFILLVSTIKYRYYMLRWLQIQAIFLLLWYVISYLFLFFQYGIPIDFPVLIAELISIFISYIINYSYLKKRWFSSFSESAKCAEQMPQTNSPLQTPHNSSTICFCRFCGNPLREIVCSATNVERRCVLEMSKVRRSTTTWQ